MGTGKTLTDADTDADIRQGALIIFGKTKIPMLCRLKCLSVSQRGPTAHAFILATRRSANHTSAWREIVCFFDFGDKCGWVSRAETR